MRLFRKKETYNEQMLREAGADGVVSSAPEPAAEPTPEQKDAIDTLDGMADDAVWREMPERGLFGQLLDPRRYWWWGSWSDPPPGAPGLRDALREDDEKPS
ncbi:MAG TPA: hypothetical protein VGH79_05285 [Gaiellaceae bacterium]